MALVCCCFLFFNDIGFYLNSILVLFLMTLMLKWRLSLLPNQGSYACDLNILEAEARGA